MSDNNGSAPKNNQRRGGGPRRNPGGRDGGPRRNPEGRDGGSGGRRGGGGNRGQGGNTRDKENRAPARKRLESEMSDGTGDHCTVCLYQIETYAVGECNHSICYKCATRMRVLCLRNECAICRRDLPKVILSKENKKYDDLKNEIFPMDKKFKICFETEEIEDEYTKLLGHECEMCEDKPTFRNFLQMKKHMNMEHKHFYCDLCVDNLKIFSHERKHYDKQGLTDHRTKGDKDDTSFKGHPLCEYCGIRFLDNDELFKHLRKDHYFCHFCDADGNQYFFSEYKDLRKHFKKDHFLCEDPECEEQKFVVFRSEIDFKAHLLEKHTSSKADMKQNRKVDIEFSFNRREGREERDRERGGGYNSREAREERMRRFEEEQRQTTPPETVPDLVADFPSLGAAAATRPVTVTGTSTAASNAMAKKVALAAGKDVPGSGQSWSNKSGAGPTSMEEFPSLTGARGGPAPKPVQSYRPPKKTKPDPGKGGGGGGGRSTLEDFPGLPGANFVTSQPAVQSYRPVQKPKAEPAKQAKKLGGKEDFPGLPTPSRTGTAATTTRAASGPSYRPTKPAPLAAISQSLSKPASKPSKPPNQSSSKPSKPRHFDPFDDSDDDDYPSFGSGAPIGLDTNSAKAIRASGQGMDYTSKETSSNIKTIDKSVLEALQGARISGSSGGYSKKPTTTNTEEFPGLGGPSSGGGGAALGSWGAGAPNTKKNKKGKQAKGSGLGSIASFLGNDGPSKPSKSCDKPVGKATKNTSSVSPAKNGGFDFADCIVRPSKQKAPSNEKKEKPAALPTSEDFPSFDLKSRGPGLNFIRAEDKLVQSKSGQSQWNKDSNGNGVAERWDEGSSPTRSESPEKKQKPQKLIQNQNFVFLPPVDFQERNSALISTVSNNLGNKSLEFKKFRDMSAKFRSGGLSCGAYFQTCHALMEDKNFGDIFAELLVLLPDIKKQEELYTEFVKKFPGQDNKVCQCDICRQVLMSEDFDHHRESHYMDGDFPVLG